jgi:hypothetical protein
LEKSIQIYSTLTILIICKKKPIKKPKIIINIASIFITLTEINNETHDVAKIKKNKNKSKNQKKTGPIGFELSV